MNHLFPFVFSDKKWTALRLNDYDQPGDPNPFSCPIRQTDVIPLFSYGGYLEDRSQILRGFDHDLKKMIHVGVDVVMPAGTMVAVPRDCTVVFSTVDDDKFNGWGGRMIFDLGDTYLLYGHLEPDSLRCVGEQCFAGTPICVLAGPDQNGGWFPHLHAQCIRKEYFESVDDVGLIDGYVESVEEGRRVSIDPVPVLMDTL
jgi:murein DD-endopeptidase MepM/ murein hydrolase activator NlpD